MTLAWRQSLALLVCIGIVVGAHAFFRMGAINESLSEDMHRDHEAIGRGLSVAISDAWRLDGRSRALSLVGRANQREAEVAIRWVNATAPAGSARRPAAPPEVLAAVSVERDVHWVDPEGLGRLYSYVAVPGSAAGGALEISESLERQEGFARASLGAILLTAAVLWVACTAAALAVGWWFLGRRMRQVSRVVRAVASGDLTRRVGLNQTDELGELAAELDAMTERLQEARAQLVEETEARVAAVSQLRHADRLALLGTLSAGIAHELGTPLNVVSATARMIRTGEIAGAAVPEEAGVIEQQADKMTHIVRQVLDFARPRPPAVERVDLRALVTATLRLLQSFAHQHNVSVEPLAGEAPIWGAVDPAQIEQVLSNLIINAVQATVGDDPVHVEVGEDAGEGEVWIAVRDHGPGISDEIRPRLFEPFFSTKQVGQGTGLGLSVAWGIVHEHGGRIAVDAAVGGGARFVVRLPAAPEEEQP